MAIIFLFLFFLSVKKTQDIYKIEDIYTHIHTYVYRVCVYVHSASK